MTVCTHVSVADPGFPVVGEGGVSNPQVATFRENCMSKRKNLDPWGGEGVPATHPPWVL